MRPTILDSLNGIPVVLQRPSMILSAGGEPKYIGGIVSVHCPECKEESMHRWQKEGYKRLKCTKCGHEWTPPTRKSDGIPDEAPVVFCPVHGCGKMMKSISFDEMSKAQREARYICVCGSFIQLQFALYEE